MGPRKPAAPPDDFGIGAPPAPPIALLPMPAHGGPLKPSIVAQRKAAALKQRAIKKQAATPPPPAPKRKLTGREQLQAAQPGQSDLDVGGKIGSVFPKTQLEKAAVGAIGSIRPFGGGLSLSDISRIGQDAPKLTSKLAPSASPHSISKAATPYQWIVEAVGANAAAALTKNGKQKIPLDQILTDKQRYGTFALGTVARKALTKRMGEQGWNVKDAPTLEDSELAARANTPYHDNLANRLRFAAADLGAQASLFAIPKQIGEATVESVQQGSPAPIADYFKAIGQGYVNVLPKVGDRPFLENLNERPVSTVTALLPFLKFGHGLLGRAAGLSGARTVTLPTVARNVEAGVEGFKAGDETRTIPASKYPLYRAGQGISDYFLRHGQSPAELAGLPPVPEGLRNVPADLAGDARGARARIGHRLESNIIKSDRKQARAQSTLEVAQGPHVALNRYGRAMRTSPWLVRRLGGQGKEEGIRAVVLNGLVGKPSHQVELFFRQGIEKSQALAAKWRAEADLHDQAAQVGVHDPHAGLFHSEEAQRLRADADRAEANAKTQAELADWIKKNPHDFRNPRPGEKDVLDSAVKVAEQQDKLLRDSKKVDEKGSLFGRLQHNLEITRTTEGPGMPYGGEHGTPLYHEAQLIMDPNTGLRFLHNRAREQLFERPPGSEDGQDALPPAADQRTPEAEHQLGRFNRLSLLDRVAQGIGRQRARRREALGGADPIPTAEETLRASGIDPSVLGRMRAEVYSTANTLVRGGDDKAVRADQRAESLRARQMGGHSAGIAQKLQVAYHDLKTLKDSGRPINEIQRQESVIEELRRQAVEDFKPDKKVLQDESLAEKTLLVHGLRQVPAAEIDAVMARHLTPTQIEAVGPEVRTALQHEADSSPHLDRTHALIQQQLEQASRAYTDETGMDPQLAADYQRLSQHYRQRLRAYDAQLSEQGVPTGHIRLRHPDDPQELPQVRVATGEQFEHGNFGRDVHLELMGDLTALQRKAVEAKIIAHLAEGPWIMDNVADGAPAPPGFMAISKEDYDNLSSPYPDSGRLAEMLREWGSRRPAEPIEGRQVHISNELRDQIVELLKAHEKVGFLLRQTNRYRRWMLYTLPRTYVNNAGGNPILARFVGGLHSRWLESVQTLRKHPERLPSLISGRGFRTAALSSGDISTFGWRSMFRFHNSFQEDVGNVMVYLMDARKAFKQQNNLHWFNRISKWQESYVQFLEDAANGKNPDVHDWMAHSAQAFGDMHQHFKVDPQFATAFLFHRWVGHMIYLTTVSMPLHYPGRLAFIQQASDLAEQYQKEHGVFPEWAQGLIPFWSQTLHLPQGVQKIMWAISSQGANPLSTAAQTFDQGDTAQPKAPLQSLVASNLNPLFRVLGEFATGKRADTLQDFKDENGNVIGGFNWRQGINDLAANTPVVNTLWSRRGLSDNSIQVLPSLLGQAYPRYSNAAKYDPTMGAPSELGYSWWKNLLFSAAQASGVSVTALDAEGVRSQRRAVGGEIYENLQGATLQSHQAQANLRALQKMTVEQRKTWFKKNDPRGFARGDWRRIKP